MAKNTFFKNSQAKPPPKTPKEPGWGGTRTGTGSRRRFIRIELDPDELDELKLLARSEYMTPEDKLASVFTGWLKSKPTRDLLLGIRIQIANGEEE